MLQIILTTMEIFLLILTACLIPILNMWFENKVNKMEKALEEKFFSKESAKFLADKIDELGKSIKDLNEFLLNHYCQK